MSMIYADGAHAKDLLVATEVFLRLHDLYCELERGSAIPFNIFDLR